jgi:hypothetical protein
MLHKGNLVYLDLHKTGSSFLVRVMNEEVRGALRHFVKHQPAAKKQKRPGEVWVISVRDPFSYYVSLWSYGAQNRRGLCEAFEPSAYEYLYDTSNPLAFSDWLGHLAAGKGIAKRANGELANYHARSISRAAELDLGLYTVRLLTLATASPAMPNPQSMLDVVSSSDLAGWYGQHSRVDEAIRLESVTSDLRRLLARPELSVRDGAFERLESARRTNRSVHHDPLSYYDEHSRQLVRERDHLIFELFYS